MASKRTSEQTDEQKLCGEWLDRIERSKKERNTWHERGKAILKEYRDETFAVGRSKGKYNLFWANVETLRSALYSRPPVPAVTRRFYDADPVARLGSMVLERVTTVQLEAYDFDGLMSASVKDLSLPGLGQAWAEYVPVYGEEAAQVDDKGEAMKDEDGQPVTYRPVVYEYARCRYVAWSDYFEGPARTWEEVPWTAKREYMNHEDLESWLEANGYAEKQVEEIMAKVDFSANLPGRAGEAGKAKKGEGWTVVYDIWDKGEKQQIVICEGYKEKPLIKRDDPLRLSGFFPHPRPLMATTTNDSRIPRPDYDMYRHQLAEIDELSERIRILTKALKLIGIYNGGGKLDLSKVLEKMDNQMVKVDQWASFAEKGGIKGNMEFLPIKEVADVLMALYQRRESLKVDASELIGISDIQRAQSDPNETLGAQELKVQYGNRRTAERQKEVARFARDLVRLKAEIVAEHFSDETIWQASGAEFIPGAFEEIAPQQGIFGQVMNYVKDKLGRAQKPPQPKRVPSHDFEAALELLRNDKMRTFRVDIETDSTIAPDENAEKQRVTELLTAMGSFMPQALEVVKAAPQMQGVVGQLMLLAVRRFRVGRTVEGEFEQALDQMKQQGQQPPQPDPAAQAEQEKLKLKAQEVQGNLQIKEKEVTGKLALQAQKQNTETALKASMATPQPPQQ